MSGGLIILVILIAILAMIFHFGCAQNVLETWARDNGYEIIDSEYRHLMKGPFFLRSGKGHAVYHVTVRDRDGNIRRGYVRCGSWLAGLLSDHVTVEWEE